MIMMAYTGKSIPKVCYKNKISVTMEVVQDRRPSLLGCNDCECLGHVMCINATDHQSNTLKDETQQTYPQRFKGTEVARHSLLG